MGPYKTSSRGHEVEMDTLLQPTPRWVQAKGDQGGESGWVVLCPVWVQLQNRCQPMPACCAYMGVSTVPAFSVSLKKPTRPTT